MSGSIFPFDSSEHAAADVLLPFYANGTLRDEDLTFVEEHLRGCETCRREVDWLRVVYSACARSPVLQVAAHELSHSYDNVVQADGRKSAVARIREEWRRARPWTQWLIAAQLAAIVILAGWLAIDAQNDTLYRTLGAGNATASPSAVAVMFDPGTSAAELRRIVHAVDARIADGPSAHDVFVLEVPEDRIEQALSLLRSEPLVRHAARLGAREGH